MQQLPLVHACCYSCKNRSASSSPSAQRLLGRLSRYNYSSEPLRGVLKTPSMHSQTSVRPTRRKQSVLSKRSVWHPPPDSIPLCLALPTVYIPSVTTVWILGLVRPIGKDRWNFASNNDRRAKKAGSSAAMPPPCTLNEPDGRETLPFAPSRQ